MTTCRDAPSLCLVACFRPNSCIVLAWSMYSSFDVKALSRMGFRGNKSFIITIHYVSILSFDVDRES